MTNVRSGNRSLRWCAAPIPETPAPTMRTSTWPRPSVLGLLGFRRRCRRRHADLAARRVPCGHVNHGFHRFAGANRASRSALISSRPAATRVNAASRSSRPAGCPSRRALLPAATTSAPAARWASSLAAARAAARRAGSARPASSPARAASSSARSPSAAASGHGGGLADQPDAAPGDPEAERAVHARRGGHARRNAARVVRPVTRSSATRTPSKPSRTVLLACAASIASGRGGEAGRGPGIEQGGDDHRVARRGRSRSSTSRAATWTRSTSPQPVTSGASPSSR